MQRPISFVACALLACGACASPRIPNDAIVHDVYFTLRDGGPQTCAKLIDACRDELAGLPGVLQLTAGPREPELQRDRNVVDFDVALRVVFVDIEAHDAYLVAPAHVALVERFMANFEKVRVFDSRAAAWRD